MRIVLAGLVLALGLTGCDGSGDFCGSAEDMAERIQSDEFDPTESEDVRGFADEMADLADDAPDEIRADVETIADGLERLADGDITVAQEGEFLPALQRFGEYTEEECG